MSSGPDDRGGLLVRIVSDTPPLFVAGICIEGGNVVRAAPIVKYFQGWTAEMAREYIHRRGWTATARKYIPRQPRLFD